MKLQLLVVVYFTCCFSCSDSQEEVISDKRYDSTTNKPSSHPLSDSVVKNFDHGSKKINLRDSILGIWGLSGEENAAFVIEAQNIFYPESSGSYKYFVIGDSLRIDYEDYVGTYYLLLKNRDTMILKSEESQVYIRFK